MSYDQYSPSGFRLLPPVVKNILIINLIFFLATFAVGKSFNIDLNDKLGLHYFGSSKFQPYQLITYMFMHFDIWHIFFNMFAVWMFGSAIENTWGGKRFLTYYLVTGIGAAITHYAVMYFVDIQPIVVHIDHYLDNPSLASFNEFINSGYFTSNLSAELQFKYAELVPQYNHLLTTDPDGALRSATDFVLLYKREFLNAPVVIGASGAVFGVLLAFGMLFPNSLIYIYFMIPIKAKWFVIIYGALELYMGVTGTESNVAHFAHLGGMIFGFLLIRLWHKRTHSF
ncbi:MAG: rhomboid family intramembrane serine protease [Bacteroidetes bacterium]|nr:rhomboid family intramembrane serine protease [Bacteroidota bacterium]